MTTARHLDTRRSWFMWALGTFGYIVAVTQRTSFGVAGILAGQRFEAGASVISLFVVVQLMTYAALQVPVGVLADRFGTRLVLGTGAGLMALGQLDLAFSNHLVPAMVARILVGAGDAMTFTPLLRLLPAWFSAKRLPILTQLMGITGQIGQLLSAIPFAMLLGVEGWTPAFVSASALSLVSCVLALTLLRNDPTGRTVPAAPREDSLAQQIAGIVAEPGAQLAFWIHWMCASWGMLFAFMWGYPFLTRGEGLPQQTASGLISLFAAGGLPFAPLVGLLSRRAPLQRSNLAFLIAAGSAIPWAAVLLWPGRAPLWLLAVLMLGLAVSGPGSSIGFDVARSAVPGNRVGTASGFVIVAGFSACLVNIWVVGLVLDLLGGYTLDNFRVALATQFVFLGIGVTGALRARREARRRGRTQGVRYPPLSRALRREWRYWLGQWRDFLTGSETVQGRPEPTVVLRGANGAEIRVVAVLPGLGGAFTAIDVPPEDAEHPWWDARVREYLALVGNPENGVASVEVRCPDAAEAEDARREIAEALRAQGASLVHEVTVTR